MKKALAILLVVAMAFGAFADDPAANISLADFNGSATINYTYDLDSEKFGLGNETAANLKFNLFNGGSKATSGDGVWGELAIGTGDPTAVESTKDAQGTSFAIPTVSVNTAKIHFVNGDVGIALNILKPELKLGGYSVPAATGVTEGTKDVDMSLSNGLALEIVTDPINVTFKYAENGLNKAADKKLGFGADFSLKAVDNLGLYGAFIYQEKMALKAGANYNFKVEDSALYVKPGVEFQLNDKAKTLVAGLLFGWGTEGQEPGLDYVDNKTADGISVGIISDLDKTNSLVIGFYDSTLLEGLKVGANYAAAFDGFADGTVNFGAKYDKAWEDVALALHGGVTVDLNKDAAATIDYKYGVKLTNTTLIDNTDLWIAYENAKDKKGNIVVAAKIHF